MFRRLPLTAILRMQSWADGVLDQKTKPGAICIKLHGYSFSWLPVDNLGLLESIGAWIGAAPCRMGFSWREMT